jgi:hypothetical protein
MSIFVKDFYVTLWKNENKGKFVKASVSTSEKDKNNKGKYINSNWNATFVGEALDKVDGLPERTRLKILSGKISNESKEYNGEKKSFVNLVVFDVEVQDGMPSSAPKTNSENKENVVADSDSSDDLPF